MSCELEDAPTCCEATPKDDPSLPPNHGKQLAAERLRTLADWLDQHGVCDHELVNVSTDGWDDLNVHVKPESFARLMAGTPFTVNANGHAVERVDGINLICVLK
jgi:hypothetical protein